MYHQMLHTLLIAVDRFLAVSLPLHYPRLMSPGKVKGLLILTWLSPLMRLGSLAYLDSCQTQHHEAMLNRTAGDSEIHSSTSYPNGIHYAEGACYIVILAAMLVLYGKIWCVAWQHHRQVTAAGSDHHVYNMKATRTLSCLLLVYVLTWMPLFLLTLVTMFEVGNADILYILVPFFFEVGLVNSWVNFFIYVWTNAELSKK